MTLVPGLMFVPCPETGTHHAWLFVHALHSYDPKTSSKSFMNEHPKSLNLLITTHTVTEQPRYHDIASKARRSGSNSPLSSPSHPSPLHKPKTGLKCAHSPIPPLVVFQLHHGPQPLSNTVTERSNTRITTFLRDKTGVYALGLADPPSGCSRPRHDCSMGERIHNRKRY